MAVLPEMAVNLDSTNRWLTLAANIGVLAGIIFLAYELQQNTVATRVEAASNFNSSFSEIELFIAGNPEFAELLAKGREGVEVTGPDQLRLMVFYNQVLRQWQFTHVQYISEVMDEDNWLAQRAFMAEIIGGDIGLMNHWRTNKLQYNSKFNNMLDSIADELRQ
ncbi:MAG: hypothetical protein GWP67_14315 [Gammaproteobacteria bacterium]|jgi:hypothetical protein|nr:hypothetical protein [Gammaproteobacteria bacterium]